MTEETGVSGAKDVELGSHDQSSVAWDDILKQEESNNGCCSRRMKNLFVPLSIVGNHYDNQNNEKDASTLILIRVEAFRMWFYVYFWIFSILAVTVSKTYSDIDLSDNPIINVFGANNMCIYFDYAPFNLMAAFLFIPCIFLIVFYELFDNFRIYDGYKDGELTKKFYYIYSGITLFEIIVFFFLIQTFATSPFENMWFHSMPYVLFGFAVWTLALKKFYYFYKYNLLFSNLHHGNQKCAKLWQYGGYIYLVLLFLCGFYRLITMVPNMAGAKLWEIDGLAWTNPVSAFNGVFFLMAVMVFPMIIYFIFSPHLDPITIVINRKVIHPAKLQN